MGMGRVTDLIVEGVDTKDYPDFCDAYFSHGTWEDTGEPLTEEELEEFQEENPELLSEMAFEGYL